MRDTWRRMEIFPAFDRDSVTRHLEKMAQRGWRLERMGPFYWRYRRMEPKKLAVHVSFFPASSPFRPAPTPGEEEFTELCGHSGWTLAAKNERIWVLYNEAEAPAPVETDPWIEAAMVHAAAMGGAVPMGAAILLCAVYMLFSMAEGLMGGTAALGLSGLSVGFGAAISALAAIYYALELTAYFSWYIRAKRAAILGERASYAKVGGALRVLQWAALFTLLAWGVSAAIFGHKPLALALAPWAFALFAATDALAGRLRRAGAPQALNRALVLCASAALFAVRFVI